MILALASRMKVDIGLSCRSRSGNVNVALIKQGTVTEQKWDSGMWPQKVPSWDDCPYSYSCALSPLLANSKTSSCTHSFSSPPDKASTRSNHPLRKSIVKKAIIRRRLLVILGPPGYEGD